ncbi:MAG: general secretion pathway protein GspB [Marinobacter sp.]|uniref:general secretion pathway protein GspB n=1 Tax=Marinobacter sp. TaxID=50741 RepID=UPI00299D0226|nr:general secretion pathway protein GspB [Marinobacter sp.]MDX1754927.1 general secretion pathway protein GspB [Marinobacter sp.]
MSYILDALRKSESERRQGQVPDLGQQVQLIHRPKPKSVPASVWVAIALVLNAAVLAYVFWPGRPVAVTTTAEVAGPAGAPVASATAAPTAAESSAAETVPGSRATADVAERPARQAPNTPQAVTEDPGREAATASDPDVAERPTVIVPSPRRNEHFANPGLLERPDGGQRVPHLVELPLSFQKGVPNLIFNSHIYASDPAARRVMINDHYLRVGDTFSGIRVDRITEEGVELSKDGRRFRVGVVRDWISPR